jgi:exosortase/archaeosortase family protein
MNRFSQISIFSNAPLPVKAFLKKALLIFIIWKLLYHLLLFPIRVPDKQLTDLTAYSTMKLYNTFLKNDVVSFKEETRKGTKISSVSIAGRKVINIADGCNGLELYVLYVGFLLCIPTTYRRLVVFTLVGTISIYVANSFRCFGLAWLFLNNYSFADFAHHYVFKMIIYAMIFFAWVKYSEKYFSYA